MKIYELIRKLRKEKGMTQQEVADKVHVTVQTVNQYEKGKRKIESEMLVSLLKALDYDFSIKETFLDREIFAIQWNLSFYYDYLNNYGMICSDFRGAKEISKDTFEKIQELLINKKFSEVSIVLEEETHNIPDEGDIWDSESWIEFFESAQLQNEELGVRFGTTEVLDESDIDSYMSGSFLTVKRCMLSDIKDVRCEFERISYY